MSAQSLIARDSTDRGRVCHTAWLLVRLAGFLAVVLAGLLALCFLFGAYLFSPDAVVIEGVHDLVVPVRASLWHRAERAHDCSRTSGLRFSFSSCNTTGTSSQDLLASLHVHHLVRAAPPDPQSS